MPRYELSEGTSNKFWQIELEGSSFTTTYGRIGSSGQSTTKTFDSAAKAQTEYQKLVSEKTKKGYQLVDGTPAPVSTAAGSVPVAAPAPKAAAAKPAKVAAPAASASAAAVASASAVAAAATSQAPAQESSAPASAARAASSAAGDAAPSVVMSDAAKRAATKELSSLKIDPLRTGNVLGEWGPYIHEPFAEWPARYVKNGMTSGDDESQRVLNTVLKTYGFGKMPAQLDLDAAAAALQLFANFEDQSLRIRNLVKVWVAHSGLTFALDAFVRSLWDRTITRGGPGHGAWLADVQYMSPPQRTLKDLFSKRVDRMLHALYLGASEEERTKAKAHAEQVRGRVGLLERSAIASCLLEPAWIDADLREAAATKKRAMLSPEALARASVPADIAAYMGAQNVEDTKFYTGTGLRWQHQVEGHAVLQGFSYVQRHGIGGVDIVLAQIRALLPEFDLTAYGEAFAGAVISELLEVAACARDYAPLVEVCVSIIEKTGDEKLTKEVDPRPRAYDCVRGSPGLALPLVRGAGKKAWAKHLLPQLERLAGGGADAARAEASVDALPVALRTPAKFRAPEFWRPAAFARIVLRDGTLFPLEHIDAVGAVLKDANRDVLATLRKMAEPEALATFGWDLFQAWLTSGSPSKDKWAFLALGHLGSDETARRLTPMIRAWPGESQHQRAVAGLDVLGEIGSDVALMMLNGIAQKVKFKGLQERAREKMDEIAQKRGMTGEQLADRLVPDLDLEDDGSKTLDFGPRSFRVGFDETLAPFVVDATGTRLKDLPKPNSKDDAALAGAATETWKAMKKDVRALASIQILRLELAMGNARRWSGEEFRNFFVEHPLLTHLVRRLVWGVYESGTLARTFRVAEDRSYADQNDDAFELAPTAQVGIVHRLHLSDADAAAWGKLFGDYELAQPFEQLGRSVFRLEPSQRAGAQLKLFENRVIETKKLMSLLSRGWRKGQAQDAGMIYELTKPISATLLAMLPFTDGINAGGFDYVEPTQTLGAVDFSPSEPSWGARKDAVPLDMIDEVVLSEVLRDIDSLGQVAS